MKVCLLLLAVVAVASAQSKQVYTTPVPILKQIDKHNDDGSYSYGYENADGTYKIETKYPTGEVFGKYGYIDDRGQLREVEYGASRRGFEPAGTDVTVPPPTLNQNPAQPLGPDEEDDGQYREDPAMYYKKDYEATSEDAYARPAYQMSYNPTVYGQPRPTYTQPTYTPPARPTYTTPVYNPSRPAPTYAPAYTPPPPPPPIPTYNPPAPQYNYAPQRPYWNPQPPAYPGYNMFQGHPAQNVDIWSGSYTVNYRR